MVGKCRGEDTPNKRKNRKWADKNKERIRQTRTKYIQNNQAKYLWSSTKQSSRKRGIAFTIEPTDVVIPKFCPYLGIELTNIIGEYRGKVNTNASIDRIDNSKGYEKGNIQVISALANKMKSEASIETLKAFARGVLEVHKD